MKQIAAEDVSKIDEILDDKMYQVLPLEPVATNSNGNQSEKHNKN